MARREEQVMPRARKEGLVVKELPDEVLVYDLDRHKAHCLNRTAALVWNRCDGETTVGEIAQFLEVETDIPAGEDVVWLALDQLGKNNLLEERVGRPGGKPRVTRREVVRKIGLAAMLSIPVVTSILAPTASAAASCVGRDCSSDPNVCAPSCICNGLTCE